MFACFVLHSIGKCMKFSKGSFKNKTQNGPRCAKTGDMSDVGDMGYMSDWVDGADKSVRVSFV